MNVDDIEIGSLFAWGDSLAFITLNEIAFLLVHSLLHGKLEIYGPLCYACINIPSRKLYIVLSETGKLKQTN